MLPTAAARSFCGGVMTRDVFPVFWMTSYFYLSRCCSKSPPGWGSEAHTQPWAWRVGIHVAGSGLSGLLLAVTEGLAGNSPGGNTGGGVCGLWLLCLSWELAYVVRCAGLVTRESWASAHRGKWGQLTPPWKMDKGWKIKRQKHARNSSFLCLCYILRAIRAGRCRERRYADHIFIQLYFRMHHFVVNFSKFSSSQAARAHWPPNQNTADVPDESVWQKY